MKQDSYDVFFWALHICKSTIFQSKQLISSVVQHIILLRSHRKRCNWCRVPKSMKVSYRYRDKHVYRHIQTFYSWYFSWWEDLLLLEPGTSSSPVLFHYIAPKVINSTPCCAPDCHDFVVRRALFDKCVWFLENTCTRNVHIICCIGKRLCCMALN